MHQDDDGVDSDDSDRVDLIAGPPEESTDGMRASQIIERPPTSRPQSKDLSVSRGMPENVAGQPNLRGVHANDTSTNAVQPHSSKH